MKRILVLSIMILGISFGSYNASAKKVESSVNTTETVKAEERAKILNDRLIEIKEMDKSNLTAAERRELRSEVKEIKQELAQLSGGVYLSIGAIIVVLLLLILLL